jgi:hypothetical protein
MRHRAGRKRFKHLADVGNWALSQQEEEAAREEVVLDDEDKQRVRKMAQTLIHSIEEEPAEEAEVEVEEDRWRKEVLPLSLSL